MKVKDENMVGVNYVAEELRVSHQTIHNWAKRGILVPDYVSTKGTRYYKLETINAFKEKRGKMV